MESMDLYMCDCLLISHLIAYYIYSMQKEEEIRVYIRMYVYTV